MHRHHPARVEVEKSTGSIGRAGMDVAEGRRIVSADRKQSQFRRQTTANLAEACKIGRIAGMIDRVLPCLQHVSTVAAVRILENLRSPMPRRNMRHRQTAVTRTVPPVEFDDL